MSMSETIIHPRWLIPVVPRETVLTNTALLVQEGVISDIGALEALHKKAPNAEVVKLPNHALTPGLINAHGHAAMTLFRGMADDLPLHSWLENHIWPAEAKYVDEQFVETGVTLAIAEMLRSGTTCFSDMYFFPDITARLAQEIGMRAVVGLIVLDFPTVWAENADEYISKGIALNDDLKTSSLVTAAFAPHAPYTVSDAPLQRVQTLADELNLPVHIHLHETEFEVTESVNQIGVSPIERLHELGLLTPKLIAVHMTQLQPREIDLIAECGVHVVHCPHSNLKLASGLCPTHTLKKAGVNVALGTDSAASNNNLDLIEEMRTASLLSKLGASDAAALPAWQALEMATINGAKALNLDSITGSIEIGKAADLAAIDLSHERTTPVFNPVSSMVFSANGEQVTDVWVQGQRLLKNNELTTINLKTTLANANSLSRQFQPSATH